MDGPGERYKERKARIRAELDSGIERAKQWALQVVSEAKKPSDLGPLLSEMTERFLRTLQKNFDEGYFSNEEVIEEDTGSRARLRELGIVDA